MCYDGSVLKQKKEQLKIQKPSEKIVGDKKLQTGSVADLAQAKTHSQAYRDILAYDYQSQAWIEKPQEAPSKKERRNTRKNIDENYSAITGKKTGLSRSELKKRKSEFEDRRELSNKASMAVAEYLEKEEEQADEISLEDRLTEIENKDPGDFQFESDEEFLQKFQENLPLLASAENLYSKLLDDESLITDEIRKTAVMQKLAWFREIKETYDARIKILTSPYYVSMRDADFTDKTVARLKKMKDDEKKDDSLRSYAKAVISWKEKEKRLKGQYPGKEVYSDEEAAKYLERDRLNAEEAREDKYQSAAKLTSMTERYYISYTNKTINGKNEDDMDSPLFKGVAEWIKEDLKNTVTAEDFSKAVNKWKTNIEKSKNSNENKAMLISHLDKVEKAVQDGKVGLDVATIWLDRALMTGKNLGGEMYFDIQRQKWGSAEDNAYYTKTLGSMAKKYMEKTSGMIAMTQTDKQEYTIEKEKQGKALGADSLGDELKRKKPTFLHFRGKLSKEGGNTKARVYISAKPEYKAKAIEILFDEISRLGFQDKIHFKVSTTAKEYRVDDVVMYFQDNLTDEEILQLLDAYSEKCKSAGNILGDDDEMSTVATKYKKGISMAPEPLIATLLNASFFYSSSSNYKKGEKMAGGKDKVRPDYSYTRIMVDMLHQSAMIAKIRLKKKDEEQLDLKNQKDRVAIKKAFRELCFMQGIDPETMMDESTRQLFTKANG